MKRILLDQNVPEGVRRLLSEHDVLLAYDMGWARLENGRLLQAAEQASMQVLITCDQNLRHQQTIAGRSIAVVVLGTNRWNAIRLHADKIAAAVDTAAPGTVLEVPISRAAARRTRG
jgi:hypothetical protein